MEKFISKLRRLPRFEVRLGRLQKIQNQFEQKQVDILFGLDMQKLSFLHVVQKFIIVTGDSDFVPVIKIAKNEGTITHLFYNPAEYVHAELIMCCDERSVLDQKLIEKCLLLKT